MSESEATDAEAEKVDPAATDEVTVVGADDDKG